AVYYFSTDSGVTILSSVPDTNDGGGTRSQTLVITLSGLTPGKAFSFYTDVDPSGGNGGEDFRHVLFNNGVQPNSVATVYHNTDGSRLSTSLTWEDGAAGQYSYTFNGGPPSRGLKVKSIAEVAGSEFVRKVTVKVDNAIVQDSNGRNTANIGEEVVIPVFDG